MGFEIQRGFFDSLEQVLDDVKKTGYWPTTFVSPASPELPLHWHEADVNGYVIEGSTYLLDEHGVRLPFEKGDKLILPRGALHAEGATKGDMIYIVASSEPDGFAQILKMRSPDEVEEGS